MIEVRNLKKSYPDVCPVSDFNCVINDGDIIAVIGPSGCGKSTFLRCLNLIETPDSGEIFFDGKDILKGELSLVEVRKYAGMVFQGYNIYPHYNILENIMVPQVDILKRTKQEAYDRAMENLRLVDLANIAYKMPHQLSGGQKQRVAIARTLAMDNEVILLDEPTSALDPIMTREVEFVLKKLAKAGKTMVLVTHNMQLARKLATRVFFLTDGVIYEEGTPQQIFDNPTKEKTIKFINCVNEKSLDITPDTFEFISCMTEIGEFAEKNDMSKESRRRMEHIFEEMVAVGILPSLEKDEPVNVRMYYSEVTGRASMDISFAHINNEHNASGNEIGSKIVREYCQKFEVHPPQNEGEKTKIMIEVKE